MVYGLFNEQKIKIIKKQNLILNPLKHPNLQILQPYKPPFLRLLQQRHVLASLPGSAEEGSTGHLAFAERLEALLFDEDSPTKHGYMS